MILPNVLGRFLPNFLGSYPTFWVSFYPTFWAGSYLTFWVLTRCFGSILTRLFRFLPDVSGQFLPAFLSCFLPNVLGSYPMFWVSSYPHFWILTRHFRLLPVLTRLFWLLLTQHFRFLPNISGQFLPKFLGSYPAFQVNSYLCGQQPSVHARFFFGTSCPLGIPPTSDLLTRCPKSSSSNTITRGKLDIPFPFQNVDVGFLFLQSCA